MLSLINLRTVFSVEPFTSLSELILNRVPPSTVEEIYSFRQRLIRLEVVNSGIPELLKMLAPVKKKYWANFKPMRIGESSVASSSDSIVAPDGAEAATFVGNCWQRLTHLRLCNCGIARLDPSLHFLPHLKMLDLSHNTLSFVTHLHDCPDLVLLNLAHNRIRVLSNLSLVVANIQRLNLSHNELAMLDGIEHLRQLTKLDLSHNLLDDLGEVELLVGLPQLQELYLAGNPLAEGAQGAAAGSSKKQERRYRCSVFGCFMHDCSLQGRPLPLLDGLEMTVREEVQIKYVPRPP